MMPKVISKRLFCMIAAIKKPGNSVQLRVLNGQHLSKCAVLLSVHLASPEVDVEIRSLQLSNRKLKYAVSLYEFRRSQLDVKWVVTPASESD